MRVRRIIYFQSRRRPRRCKSDYPRRPRVLIRSKTVTPGSFFFSFYLLFYTRHVIIVRPFTRRGKRMQRNESLSTRTQTERVHTRARTLHVSLA